MKFSTLKYSGATAEVALFPGGRAEAHAMIHASGARPFAAQLESVVNAASALANDLSLIHI